MPPVNPRAAKAPAGVDPPDPGPPLDLTVDGEGFRLDVDAVTHHDEIALWKASRLTLPEIVTCPLPWPPFILAGAVFLARRQRGERPSYDEVAAGIDWSTDWRGGLPDGEDPPPEALGAG